ncbi:LLM class flavin-dependent oxidoreductase [Paenisporosarcina cavernae]|uniref:LLM class flavin-dependent oxidoreductase n=1 Tax=Paenisporosarcina cavernae TaxID=2320858 RepID=A0A385YV99_9BACL|nr:LLM class flavin-dependent oxidoreductase [Paenisporosarcina cavernae]AYC30474.1 LLM class flavin-dependent oxidoreductase [Paenisporosarcina cavernae]
MHSIPLSILDLVSVREGHSNKDAIQDMTGLAKHAEKLGFTRYWLTEHHNMPSVISSATSLLIGHVLQHTDSIRVGSGGVMLPNHTPLVVAEQFGTLATIYGDRVDLGLGRAPGTDMQTARALRRTSQETTFSFPQDVVELQQYFKPLDQQGMVRAFPGTDTNVPTYILGSSTSSAILAARLGLPYAFAAHFAPTHLQDAVAIYREQFQPSEYLKEPYVIVCVNAVVTESNEQADFLATSSTLFYLNVVRRTEEFLKPPVESLDGLWSPFEERAVKDMSTYTLRGDVETVRSQLLAMKKAIHFDELMAVSYIYDQEKRKKSYTLLSEAADFSSLS